VEKDTKQKLIEVGAEAIMEKSFDGVGINHVLELAGVPKGSFYHHFKSKEEFGAAVIDHTAEIHEQEFRKMLLEGEGTPLGRLRTYFEFVREYHREHGTEPKCLILKMALDQAKLSEPIQACVKQAFGRWREIVTECLTEAQAQGELAKDLDPARTADIVNACWEGVLMRMQVDRDVAIIDSFLEFVFGRLLRAAEAPARD